uniref:Uncharacterized protein n=1 Tax=Romanomermis culicivorax TaxID=13658 RepID=A0A915HSE9_ROMCU
ISDTLLSKADLSKNQYLRQAITSHLQCKGYTVVLGTDLRVVNRMVRTLAFFEPEDHLRMCLLSSEDNTYCPYLKIQGLHKASA